MYCELITELNKLKTVIEKRLGEGYATNWESYKFLTGEIFGINEAINICEKIYKGE